MFLFIWDFLCTGSGQALIGKVKLQKSTCCETATKLKHLFLWGPTAYATSQDSCKTSCLQNYSVATKHCKYWVRIHCGHRESTKMPGIRPWQFWHTQPCLQHKSAGPASICILLNLDRPETDGSSNVRVARTITTISTILFLLLLLL